MKKRVLIILSVFLIIAVLVCLALECKKRYDEYMKDKFLYFAVANDTYYQNGSLWGLGHIEADKVWDFSAGTRYLNVGIIDSGVFLHADLVENLSTGRDFQNDSAEANDDIVGHGTFIGGIIGAKGNNSQGVAGVLWNVSIIPLQITNNQGYLIPIGIVYLKRAI